MVHMTAMNAFVVALVLVLGGALAATLWWHQRCRKQWASNTTYAAQAAWEKEAAIGAHHQNELSTTRNEHNAQLAQVADSHRNEIAKVKVDHEHTTTTLRSVYINQVAEHERATAELNTQCESLRSWYGEMRERYTATVGIGDLNSRLRIIQACNNIGLDAILLTNLVFRPLDNSVDDPFHAQIDHLLITESGGLIIENKYWKGLIYDGVDIAARQPALAELLNDTYLEQVKNAKAAMHISVTDPNTIGVRMAGPLSPLDKQLSPARQVRRQAGRLSKYIESVQPSAPWIDTCVYYSHGEAVVDHAGRSAGTVIVSSAQGLEDAIRVLTGPTNRPSVAVSSLAGTLANLGPDICGLGRYAEQWTSLLDTLPDTAKSRPASSTR